MLSRERSPVPRRGFLTGLASLPLIGGGVALLGQPTAAAVPLTPDLLDSYETWLSMERSALRFERYGSGSRSPLIGCEVVYRDRSTGDIFDYVAMDNAASRYADRGNASSRAAVILSAAGIPLTGGRDRG